MASVENSLKSQLVTSLSPEKEEMQALWGSG